MEKWLRAKRQSHATQVEDTTTRAAALNKIREHWHTVWTSTGKFAAEELKTMAANMSDLIGRAEPGRRPTPRDFTDLLQKAASEAEGKSGGLDGWSGTECADIPPEAWADFEKPARRWER